MDAAMLALEAQEVIALRLIALAAGGPKAEAEARKMIEEKITAVTTATTMMTAATLEGRINQGADDVVQMLRDKVHANRERLTE